MIDPIISLAFSLQSNPGGYALLVGSGVSRSASIPTGWEIVLDLIRKLAHLKGADPEPDPAQWFEKTFGEYPDYAKLLDEVAKSPVERSQLLKIYFEPNEDEREQGLKVPTEAHRAIAELAAKGYIKVIITTNFDRLIEKALDEQGITPIVISTPDAAEGALPLIHSKCTILKVHGDYLDTRIKNTVSELDQYDDRINKLLDRIFDEFGLIICGWSAEWDAALRSSLERCKTARFTTYWATKSSPGALAQKLITLRRAQTISIKDANTFFKETAEKVIALEELAQPHPLSAKIAVTNLKKYIVDDRHKIRLHDLLVTETEKLYAELDDNNFPVQGVQFSKEELAGRVKKYETLLEIVLSLIVNGCYWGDKRTEGLWANCINRIVNPSGERNGYTMWLNLRLYPALLLLYGGGIAAIAGGHYGNFAALITKPSIRDGNENKPLVTTLSTWDVMEQKHGQQLPGMDRRYTPLSDHLYEVLRNVLRDILPDEAQYQKCFDRFEYLYALVYADFNLKQGGDGWGPIGCFGWRYRHRNSLMKELDEEIANVGKEWPPLKAGLFDSSVERVREVKGVLDAHIQKLSWW
jgi:hypothetical protein